MQRNRCVLHAVIYTPLLYVYNWVSVALPRLYTVVVFAAVIDAVNQKWKFLLSSSPTLGHPLLWTADE